MFRVSYLSRDFKIQYSFNLDDERALDNFNVNPMIFKLNKLLTY